MDLENARVPALVSVPTVAKIDGRRPLEHETVRGSAQPPPLVGEDVVERPDAQTTRANNRADVDVRRGGRNHRLDVRQPLGQRGSEIQTGPLERKKPTTPAEFDGTATRVSGRARGGYRELRTEKRTAELDVRRLELEPSQAQATRARQAERRQSSRTNAPVATSGHAMTKRRVMRWRKIGDHSTVPVAALSRSDHALTRPR
jgi:hypothetical protein